jgi:hypothetical protein
MAQKKKPPRAQFGAVWKRPKTKAPPAFAAGAIEDFRSGLLLEPEANAARANMARTFFDTFDLSTDRRHPFLKSKDAAGFCRRRQGFIPTI